MCVCVCVCVQETLFRASRQLCSSSQKVGMINNTDVTVY